MAEKSETVLREEKVLAFWKEDKTFEKSVEKHAPKGEFIFYDGPPFATGLPHSGSLLSSIVKDVVPRYKTMRGYRVPRVWGWDTHGLPIENLVEKTLGLKTKKDILDIGIETFNEKARSIVLQYVHEWKRYVDRVGRWVDFDNSYKTMDNSYIESIWWALKRLHGKNLMYEGRKVLMYCMHCETPLAKAEIAADNTYKDITEEAVIARFKVKNPKKYNLPENTYLLAWTTTPWTLPGNVGLAVGPDMSYGIVQDGAAHYIEQEDGGTLLGKNLIGIEYEPLFDVPALKGSRSYKVWGADFVTAGEGTGIVHTAVMYGEDDFQLGLKEKLPMVQMLEANGHYNHEAPDFIRGKYIKAAEKDIKADLETRGLLHARDMHTHSYPHCWRCGTPLIYNAVPSWFFNIQKVKSKMLAENTKIHWFPEHLKYGRFKNIVENAPDWTISRNRFWASPLPIWKEKGNPSTGSGQGKLMVIGSLDELLKKTKKSGNSYFVMRHGEALSNTKGIFDSKGDSGNHLTDAGKRMVVETAQKIKHEKIDLVIVSPLLRTQETAKLVLKELGLPDSALMTDERLREISVGVFEGKTIEEWKKNFSSRIERFARSVEGGETYADVRHRVGDFLFEIERRYTGRRVLIVTHECQAWLLDGVAHYQSNEDISASRDGVFLEPAAYKKLPFIPFPHNKNFELDLHRPYIDDVVLVDEKGSRYERIPEVLDCWVESGSMPFASMQYPHSKKRVNPERFFGLVPRGYPGDFIAEYIGQTRTWFYYMHAMGVLLFGRRSFKAVAVTGNILAADGSKMSKSKQNYTDPWELMEKWGSDAYRFYLMSSVVMQAEDLNFRDDDVREAHNRVVGTLWNSFKFFELYKDKVTDTDHTKSIHPLDRWVVSLLNKTIAEATRSFDAYDMPSSCRALRSFIETYSVWYVRRSRDRARGSDTDAQASLATQRYVLATTAQLIAPIMPFLAESIWQGLGEEGSVHTSAWPKGGAVDEQLLSDMQTARDLASTGLELRDRAGIKVRQPLASFTAPALPSDPGLRAILADELNVKDVREDASLKEAALDTALSAELKEEGTVRELARRIQEWRKEQKLSITDRPTATITVTAEEKAVAEKHRDALISQTGLEKLELVLSNDA
ncbi:MAG TPA: class I tRNA ligase family protein [Candidatus Paceibacterota bacterium]|nr:class I tRNA ligase family protein [Candidatus Paceibacterota bacterium]